jgi:uncharacterized protein YndB with AHSA1/START domain
MVGTEGFRNTFELCEMLPGGKRKFIMHGPDGKKYPNECEFGEIVPNKKFVVLHTVEPVFSGVFTLAPTEKGTLLT